MTALIRQCWRALFYWRDLYSALDEERVETIRASGDYRKWFP